MSYVSEQAEPVVKKLMQADEEQLYQMLGERAHVINNLDTIHAGSLDPQYTVDVAMMGPLDEVRKLGMRIAKRWEKEIFELICGNEPDDEKDREDLRHALGISDVALASGLTAILVSVGAAPAVAAVLAALIAKRFFGTAYDEVCESWKKSVGKAG